MYNATNQLPQQGSNGTVQSYTHRQSPIPDPGSPDDLVGSGVGSPKDQEIRDAVAGLLGGQDLSGPEALQLSQQLEEQLHQATANGKTIDQAIADAEDSAAAFMANLRRAYVRKATRLGTFADADRTVDGDIVTPQRKIIPALRDELGDLVWVDPETGDVVAEGTPGAITVPEPGSYHLGHRPGMENWRILRQAIEEGWTRREFLDFMNRRGVYDLQTPADNLSHRHEDPQPYAPNPDFTPPRLRPDGAAIPSIPGFGVSAVAPPPSDLFGPGASAPHPAVLPDFSLPPHPQTLPPFLQQYVPPDHLAPISGAPYLMPSFSPPPSSGASSPFTLPDIDLGFSPADAGAGVLAFIAGLGALVGALQNPTAGVP